MAENDETKRQEAIQEIETLFGAPGSNHSTDVGERLLMTIIERHGLEALSTTALLDLAAEHRNEDYRVAHQRRR